jgi:NitT/TauT family transport system substrate-binding protein
MKRITATRTIVGFAALAAASLSFAQTSIKFALDWKFEGPSAPYFVALDKGYYKAEGLDVTIDSGNGSVEAINRVASGTYQMAFGDINSLIKFRDKKENAAVKAVAMIYDAPPFAIVSMKKYGVLKPKDLEGKILGAPAPDGAYAQWPIMVKTQNIDASKVKIENVGFPVREPMLAEGKVQAITGFSFSSYMNLRSRGIAQDEIVVMLMRDYGLELYGNAIMVNPKFAAENPKAVAGFVRATIKGVMDTIANPREATKSVIKRNAIADETIEFVRLKMALDQNFVTKEVKANGFGAVDMNRLDRSITQIGQAFTYTNRPSATDIFDGQYLPSKTERMLK